VSSMSTRLEQLKAKLAQTHSLSLDELEEAKELQAACSLTLQAPVLSLNNPPPKLGIGSGEPGKTAPRLEEDLSPQERQQRQNDKVLQDDLDSRAAHGYMSRKDCARIDELLAKPDKDWTKEDDLDLQRINRLRDPRRNKEAVPGLW
jgi:hypothetical protein